MAKRPARATSGRYVSRLTSGTLAVIMAGGRGDVVTHELGGLRDGVLRQPQGQRHCARTLQESTAGQRNHGGFSNCDYGLSHSLAKKECETCQNPHG